MRRSPECRAAPRGAIGDYRTRRPWLISGRSPGREPYDVLDLVGWDAEVGRDLGNRVAGLQDINYIDLTGNALFRVDNPSVFVRTEGSARNPAPKDRGQVRLRGAKAGRLIRLLADVRPPYGVGELAKAGGLAPGDVSRLLDALYREALVERSPAARSRASTSPGSCAGGPPRTKSSR